MAKIHGNKTIPLKLKISQICPNFHRGAYFIGAAKIPCKKPSKTTAKIPSHSSMLIGLGLREVKLSLHLALRTTLIERQPLVSAPRINKVVSASRRNQH
jgi:hypothetical protein